MKLADFVPVYLSEHVEIQNKPLTQKAVKEVLRNWIVPQFGDVQLDAILNKDLKRWVNAMHRRGLSASSINQRLKILGKLLAFYTEWEDVALPKLKMPLQRLPEPEAQCFTDAQALRIVTEAVKQPQPYGALIMLALYSGLRVGELRALKWEHLDLDVPSIRVKENLPGHASVVGTPKGGKMRSQYLHSEPLTMLLALNRLGPYMFSLPSRPLRPVSYKAALLFLKGFFASVGLERNGGFHRFRHNFGTTLARSGVALSTVQKLLGHAAISTTMRYVHVVSADEREAMGALAAKFKTSKTGGP